jgi:Domain of unknown function (DUF4333)
MRTGKVVVALAGALSVLAIGCGEETLDTDDLQSTISSGLEEQVGVAPESVECPDDITVEEGSEFQCTGTAPNGDEFTIDVTQTDDEGNIEFEVPPQDTGGGGA